MTESDLEQCYTALSQALAGVGESKASLMLGILTLAMMAQSESGKVLELIERAEALAKV
jgi:hypothetical protein